MTDSIVSILFGMALGGIVPTLIITKILCKDLLIEIKGHKEHGKRLAQIEKILDRLEEDMSTMQDNRGGWTRDDLPCDAMGDYADLDIPARQTGHESADEWYHEEFGDGN